MTEYPHMPLAIDAYVLNTTHLTLEQHGAYLLLLIAAWRARGTPRLPDDDKFLARTLGLGMKKWLSLKPSVMSFWTRGDDGFWTQTKQLEVRLAVSKRVEQAREAANARWGANPLKDNTVDYAPALPAHMHADMPTKTKPSYEGRTRPKGLVSEPNASDASSPKSRSRKKAYTPEFEAAWLAYPTDANMSKAKAYAAWTRLGVEDRVRVAAAIPAFVVFCRKDPTYRPVHMVRFISERRFEGHGDMRPATTLVTVEDWERRLTWARAKRQWSVAEWGPMPGADGCLAPVEMLKAGDGDGWTEWRATA